MIFMFKKYVTSTTIHLSGLLGTGPHTVLASLCLLRAPPPPPTAPMFTLDLSPCLCISFESCFLEQRKSRICFFPFMHYLWTLYSKHQTNTHSIMFHSTFNSIAFHVSFSVADPDASADPLSKKKNAHNS